MESSAPQEMVSRSHADGGDGEDGQDGSGPVFSIITAAYHCCEKLAGTMDSVLGQGSVSMEYLVVDGGSTDGTVEQLRARGSAVRWVSEPDRGVYDAMNKGIGMARGRYLYFIGAGDRLRPGVLRQVQDDIERLRLLESPQPVFLYGDVFSEAQGRLYGGVSGRHKMALLNVCHQAIFYDRRIFDQLGGYDLRYRILADHEMNMRCMGRADIRKVRLERVVADYEAAGLSAARDEVFLQDQEMLVLRHLGRSSWWFYKMRYWFPGCFRRWVLPRLERAGVGEAGMQQRVRS